MGSGSSKEKVPKRTNKPVNDQKSSKIGKNDPVISETSGPTKFQAKNVNTLKHKNASQEVEDETFSQSNEKPATIETFVPNKTSNGHVKKREPVKNLGKFESDSDSEPEDIAEVLAATRAANNNQIQEQNFYNTHKQADDLPETYAQRLQREQYRHEQQGLIREKTIYRNPEEWNVEEYAFLKTVDPNLLEPIQAEKFDATRFKQANIARQAELDRDIYSPVEVPEQKNVIQRYNANDQDPYNEPPTGQDADIKNLPKYDMSEEALLAEIENQF